jgi:hypothetical protein
MTGVFCSVLEHAIVLFIGQSLVILSMKLCLNEDFHSIFEIMQVW